MGGRGNEALVASVAGRERRGWADNSGQLAASCQKLAGWAGGRALGWLQGCQRTPAVGAVDWVVREEGAHAGPAAVYQ
jgi:hypothetical protein